MGQITNLEVKSGSQAAIDALPKKAGQLLINEQTGAASIDVSGAERVSMGGKPIIFTELAPDDPGFPDDAGAVILTTAGQPGVGPAGEDGVPGATGATPNIQIGTVLTVASNQDASATITGTPENPRLNLSIPRGAAGSGGGGLPESVVVCETWESLANWTKIPGTYIIVPGVIEAQDDWGVDPGVTIDGIGRGHIRSNNYMFYGYVYSGGTTLKNIRLDLYDAGFEGSRVVIDNCRIKTSAGCWFCANTDGDAPASYMIRNSVFGGSVGVNPDAHDGGAVVTGCVFSGSLNKPQSDRIVTVGNLENTDVSLWGLD